MIIDSHTHIGRNEHINVSVIDLLRSMDEAKIDKALVFAGMINDCPNDYLMKEIYPYKDRLYGIASVDLNKADHHYGQTGEATDAMSITGMLRALREGAVGVKVYLGYEHYHPYDDVVRNVIHFATEENVPVIFHAGDCLNSVKCAKLRYSHPLNIDDVAVDFPDTKMVIAHMGYPWHRDAAEVCYKNKNVYADISGFVYGKFLSKDRRYFHKTIEEFVSICPRSKLLFGTDFPISDQSSYMKVGAGAYNTQNLSDNILKVFNI